VPFCASRCDYCAFATWTDRHALREAYVDACIAQIRRECSDSPWAWPAETVFLGGGTPSQLATGDLVRLLDAVPVVSGAEITVEANPEDVTDEWAAAVVGAGATRVSLGVQSLDPVALAGLGRAHDPAAVVSAARALGRAGIAGYSVDLIYGGAGETDRSWEATVSGALALEPAPSHVSAYALTVEPGTPLAADARRHPDDDVQATRYEIADDLLSAAGLGWYEISNWARPGHESRHNCNYWAGGDYLAIGAAAHGHRAGRRWWNVRTPERYIAAVTEGRDPVAVTEDLDPATRSHETLQLSLRTRSGLPRSALRADDPALEGLVAPEGDRLVLTRRGRLLANEVALRILDQPICRPADRSPDGLKHH
jgi:oxygen-independent coproporphyrinogen-3 oxidase